MQKPFFAKSIVVKGDSEAHLFADLSPGLLQAVDGAAVERRCDLQHPVVVVETATDVGHGHPLLYGAGPGAHVGVGHDLGRHQVAHLQWGKEMTMRENVHRGRE